MPLPVRNGESTVRVHTFTPVSPPPSIPPIVPQPPPLGTQHPPPYIFHINVDSLTPSPSPVTLLSFLCQHTPLTPTYARQLAAFGAIYIRTACPNRRKSPRPTRLLRNQLEQPVPIHTPLYLRIYAIPKRHPTLTPFSILRSHSKFLAVCKPAGIPVAPSVDNSVDCLLALARQHTATPTSESSLSSTASLCITTRLDIATSGVVLLSTASCYTAQINEALATADKRYIVWTYVQPRVGTLTHWYNNAASRRRGPIQTPLIAPYTPQPPSHETSATSATKGTSGTDQHSAAPPVAETATLIDALSVRNPKWVCASLVVMSVRRAGTLWQSRVRLLTGRTHQIRMQFAAEGWPLVGDCKYAPSAGDILHPAGQDAFLGEDAVCVGLHAFSLSFMLDGEREEVRAPVELRGTVGVDGLCLQTEEEDIESVGEEALSD